MKIVVGAAVLLTAAAAQAEVKSVTPASFEVQSIVTVPATPAEAYAMIGRIGEWWSPDHTYSGKAANLSLGLKAGDCFCERLHDGGSVEHLRVVYAKPASALRLHGGLGPLQSQAVAGTLIWSLKAVSGGTEITQTYSVAGSIKGGAESLAGPVDQVLTLQLTRLKDRLAR